MRNPNLFNSVPVKSVKRTAFDLSHEVKLSCDMGQLIPFVCEEVLPGDTFKVRSEHLVRFAPMLAPIMHRVDVFTHFFFVPNRIIWDNWENFITGGVDGSLQPHMPQVEITPSANVKGTLSDYLGIPTSDGLDNESFKVSALPFRAYWDIYNSYYVDQNVGKPIEFAKGDEDIFLTTANNVVLNRCWEKDYFTSALPWPQRNVNPVTIPVSGDAEVYRVPIEGFSNQMNAPRFMLVAEEAIRPGETERGSVGQVSMQVDNGQNHISVGNTSAARAYDPQGTLKARLSDTSAVNINELRRAFSLQRWMENAARTGSRYIEQLLGHFGVRSSDSRLQRPEYLGGGKSPVVISDVEQTSAATSESTPLGQLGGQGTSYGSTHSFKRFFEEHGWVIGIISVMPKPCYQDGLHRKFFRNNRFDFYWPEFANLGEQEILGKEIYFDPDDTDGSKNDSTFGYTPRYAEYRFINSSVHGDFRDNLDFWHMGRKFSSRPGLNESFLQCNAGVPGGPNRVFAVQDVQHLWVQTYVKFLALRKMPKYGKPGL